MSTTTVSSPPTRVLRSDCRNHGSGSCTCATHELPSTPRRRSMSRTPSRASSVAPELTHSPSTSAVQSTSHLTSNGSVETNLSEHVERYFHSQQQQHYQKESYEESVTRSKSVRTILDEQVQSSSSVQQQRCNNFIEDDRLSLGGASSRISDDDSHDFMIRQRNRQNRSMSASPQLESKYHSSRRSDEKSRSRTKIAYSAIHEVAESDGDDGDDSTLHLNSSMASSISPSFRSASSHDRSRVSSACRVTTSTTMRTTGMNGNHVEKNHRLISVLRSPSVARGEGDTVVGTSGRSLWWESRSYVERCQSWLESAWSSARKGLLFLPQWIYWTLVNLFVYEKWLLHQRSVVSSREFWRKCLILLLLLLLGASVYSFVGLFTSLFKGPIAFPLLFQKSEKSALSDIPKHPPGIPPVIYSSSGDSEGGGGFLHVSNVGTSCPDLSRQKEEYEKLVAKVDMLEKMTEDYKRASEKSYSHQLNIFKQNLEIQIREEIQKIEPSKVVVEKHTVVEKEVLPPTAEPEPIDVEKLSSTLLPLVLPLVMEKVKSQVEESKVECPDCPKPEPAAVLQPAAFPSFDGIDLSEVGKMIRAAIAKYDADKTGLPDLALEPAGGTVLSTRCTKSSQSKNSVLTLWGWRVWSFSNSPRTIIQPGVVPGECWVVEGATAEVVIQLISPAVITGFTLEHIPKAISPYGKIDTAPRKFQVVGLMSENDVENGWDYGTFEYLDNDEPIQYFEVQNKTDVAYPIVELRVLSNHGSVRSTCIYRFRVHGLNIDRTA